MRVLGEGKPDNLRRRLLSGTFHGMMEIAMRIQICSLTAAVLLIAGTRARAETWLVDVKPTGTEWGTEKHDAFPAMQFGPRVVDWMSAGNQGAHWPGETKIVKSIPADLQLEEGKAYSSGMTNAFAVAGEWMTGVGLWARRMSFYHWIEYAIPAGAKRFTGKLYVTDDPRGFAWWGNANQQFRFQIFVDGQELKKVERTRTSLSPGSGELLEDLALELPASAKTIRFRVANSGWGDGNCNTELVIHDGKFAP